MKAFPSTIHQPATEPLLDRQTFERLRNRAIAPSSPTPRPPFEPEATDPIERRELLGDFYPHRQSKGGAK